jgi:hypothetical protein
MDTTLKVEFEGAFRRVLLKGTPCFADIERVISELWPGRSVAEARYKDDEGDLCCLTTQTFDDFLTSSTEIANGKSLLRLQLVPVSHNVASMEERPHQSIDHEPEDAGASPPHITSEAGDGFEESVRDQSERDLHAPETSANPAGIEAGIEEISTFIASMGQSASEQVAEAQRQASEQFADFHRAASQHFESSRPRLADGFENFKRQVVTDFQSSSQDMKDAFGPAETAEGTLKGKVRKVAGISTGFVAALRLAPVRATKLTAHSVAAVIGTPATCDVVDSEQTEQANITDRPGDTSEISHFKHLVTKDFKDVKSDVKSSFGCIIGESSSNQRATDASERPSEPQSTSAKTVIPEVVSTVAGVGVACWLMPLRAARFAVGAIANGSVFEEPQSAPNAGQSQAEQPTAQGLDESHAEQPTAQDPDAAQVRA